MQKEKINSLLVKLPTTLNKLIKKINKVGLGIIFIIDENKKLIGSISDGDLRRYLLHIKKKPKFIKYEMSIVNKNPYYLPVHSSIEKIINSLEPNKVLINKKKIKIKCIPLVNSNKKIVDISTALAPREYKIANPNLGSLEHFHAIKAIKSNWISSRGSYIKLFEESVIKNIPVTIS